MPKLTEKQSLAVNKSNTNIIVSAGAGSGKTTVLKTRVERLLMEGTNINELIILTFTNAAAAEMKDRIRKVIKKNKNIAHMEEYLDSAYITTFDSFAQSMVKKYANILNMSDKFTIIDANIVNLELDKIVNDVFEELYASGDILFTKFIHEQTLKNDKDIRSSIKSVYHSLQNKIDVNEYLDSYLNHFYDISFVNETFNEFENYVFSLRDDVLELIQKLNEHASSDTQNKNEQIIAEFENASSYDELINTLDFKLVQNRNDAYDEEAKEIISKISDAKKKLKEACSYGDKKMLISNYLSTFDYAKCVIGILKEIHKRLQRFKKEKNAYEFIDIALKAIELVRDHEEVRNEIKCKTKEIMIDEYQDTNDIQEEFISYIQNNNVYMVGDIKQSIYRFRNANPYIFKSKYDNYKDDKDGFKIDLMENFRSRNNVVSIINRIFANIMTDDIGGCDYKREHMMIYGNKSYEESNFNYYNAEILNYDEKEPYSKIEKEAFIIVDDIKKHIKNKEQVTYYKDDKMCTRDIDYKDFTILIDKSTAFEDFKKILEANNIPTSIKKDINIKDEDEIHILKNLITLIIKIKKQCLDTEFTHAFASIARSYLYELSDDELFNIIINKKYKNTDIYKKCESLSVMIDSLSNRDILAKIIEEFDFYNRLLHVDNVNERLIKIEYFVNNSTDLNKFGLNIYALNDYFDEILNDKSEIKMKLASEDDNSVKIMTIHTSKGLEFPYVYLPMLTSNFYKSPNKDPFALTNKYGITLPFYNDGIGTSFVTISANIDEMKETLSEKIRLYYVALTRAKEKVIMVLPSNEIGHLTSDDNMLKYKSFADIINALKLNDISKFIEISKLNVNKDYNSVKVSNYKSMIEDSNIKIKLKELNIENKVLESKHFSKSITSIIDECLRKKLDFGTFMHYVFEVYDFKNNNLDALDISDVKKSKVMNFLKHDEVKNIKNAKIYKEHEIRFNDGSNTYHGFIDLLLEYDDHFDIIDYKLSNLESDEYRVQLSGYKKYIEENYQKKTNIYLYSINKDIFKKLN